MSLSMHLQGALVIVEIVYLVVAILLRAAHNLYHGVLLPHNWFGKAREN